MKIKTPKQRAEDVEVIDESENEKTVSQFRYDITSYGIDYDVEGLVSRLNRKDIFVPPFQRDFVWSLTESSKFVESLLLGLPVPGIFLAKELEGNKMIVIDGQQRIKSLQFFYEGEFNPKEDQTNKRTFKLQGVEEQFENATYASLDSELKRMFNDSVIHATIIKQEKPLEKDSSSIYKIFERLNTGGRKLAPQEIRAAIAYGTFLRLLEEVNASPAWRKIFGRPHSRLKDRELILRFFAFFHKWDNYTEPMKDFLNDYVTSNRNPSEKYLRDNRKLFNDCIKLVLETIGEKAFRPERSINAAVFDSVMVGLASRMRKAKPIHKNDLVEAYEKLLKDRSYVNATSQSTASLASVSKRMKKSIAQFDDV